jgi:hypothetical protein
MIKDTCENVKLLADQKHALDVVPVITLLSSRKRGVPLDFTLHETV